MARDPRRINLRSQCNSHPPGGGFAVSSGSDPRTYVLVQFPIGSWEPPAAGRPERAALLHLVIGLGERATAHGMISSIGRNPPYGLR